MDKTIAIEVTLRPVDADRTDDTAGHGIVIEERQLPRQEFLFIPIVIRWFNPQTDPPVKAQGQDVRGFVKADANGADDVAGHAVQAGTTPTLASSQMWQLAPGLALKLTLPDSAPPVFKAQDVAGFMMRSKHLDEPPGEGGSGGPGSPFGLLAFIAEPIGDGVGVLKSLLGLNNL